MPTTENSANLAATIATIPTHEDIPPYHYAEALTIAKKIEALQNADTFVFGVITDCHVRTGDTYETETKRSIDRAAFALEAVGKMTGVDFIANLGDNQWENNIDTAPALASMEYLNRCVSGVFADFPSFRIPGNHDQSSTFGKVYQYVGAYNTFDSTVATPQRGYGFKDFSAKRYRVICLNTSDYYNATGGYGMSYEQKQFLMSALDLSAKPDAASWKIILLSHIPLDYPGGDYNTVNDVQAILNAYVQGGSVNITVNSSYAAAEHESVSGTLTYNYSGKNTAKIVANFHGHIHNHCYGRMEDSDIVRVCAPNTCFKLEKSASSYGDGMYDVTTAYPKTIDTADETAVTFYVIDAVAEEINAIVYGAGIDRIVSFADKEPPIDPYEYTVPDLAIGSRSNWEVAASGTSSSGIELANGNTQIAVGVSTQNILGFTDRDSNPLYVMPVPARATNVSVTCDDQAMSEIYFRGIKFSGSNYTRVFNTGWQTGFSTSFDLGAVDYITIALRRTDGISVSWNYPEAYVSVVFSNGL